jgi:signal transduction histidine kinase
MLLRAPFSPRALAELLFCLTGVGFGLAGLLVPFILIAGPALALGAVQGRSSPAVAPGFLVSVPVVLAGFVLLGAPLGRRLATVHRGLARRWLGESIPAPAPARARVGDRPGWRALAYTALKVPLAVPEGYAVLCWAGGLVNLTYPLWWRLFRNHPPGVQLSPAVMVTPLGAFEISTFAGTFAAAAAGLAMVLVAPWIARAATTVDRTVMRSLLAPGRLAERVRVLEQTRAHAVDETATMLRRFERNLHDGAQVRLAALAMNLGRAREQLGDEGEPPDLAKARALIDGAHRSAKDALADLRDLARGIHPAVLDNGLGDALASLGASAPIPTRVTTRIAVAPSPAIETIAYFCVSELVANAVKHSRAQAMSVQAADHNGRLQLTVTDDGVGGADPDRGTGLTGLAARVATVDGRLDISSPAGGPTQVTIDLPMRA